MTRTPHCFLAGEAVNTFAQDCGLALQDPEYFITEPRKRQLEQARAEHSDAVTLDHSKSKAEAGDSKGTVGAVVLDAQGNLAGMNPMRFKYND